MQTRDKRLIAAAALVIMGAILLGFLLVIARVGSGPFAKASDEASYRDLGRLDAYAEELGIVMTRTGGPAEQHAAMVDGPGPDLEVLVADGDSYEDEAIVVLRLTVDHEADTLFSSGSDGDDSTVSVCYRWTFRNSIDDRHADRLDDCPPGPVLSIPPATVRPPAGG